jgi:four helix bundle protein
MKPNLVKDKSYHFAISIFPVYQELKRKREYTIANQLWRSATSVGANIEEAVAAFSRTDFTYRLVISLKEARETRYWLRLLRDVRLIENVDTQLLEIESIINLLTRIIKTLTVKSRI